MTQPLRLYNLPVYTVSGIYLGRVVDFEVDKISRQVIFYHIKTKLEITGLWQKNILISPKQIIELSAEKMVVEDLLSNQKVPTHDIGLVPESF